jgi:hypothetical protein
VKTLLDLQTMIPVPRTVNLPGTLGIICGRFVVLQLHCNESFTFCHVLLNFWIPYISVWARFKRSKRSILLDGFHRNVNIPGSF